MSLKQLKGPEIAYKKFLDREGLRPDHYQQRVVRQFQNLYEKLIFREELPSKWFKAKWFSNNVDNSEVQGIYLWGGVGRGKTMLMDFFYEEIPTQMKRRVHYHSFMQELHQEINIAKVSGEKISDPIDRIVARIASETELLCFDEFQVTDIGDAMVLGRLFEKLISAAVVPVITSNRAPDQLYYGGINRDRFLPFIDFVKQKMQILELGGYYDYRQLYLRHAELYVTPLGPEAKLSLAKSFEKLTGGSDYEPIELEVQGRTMSVRRAAKGVGWFSFIELCGKPVGASDYLAIQSSFQTILIEEVPQMGPDNRNEAKRFVTLIDVLYENRIRTIISAEVLPEKLYKSGNGHFEFNRTVSRLNEMQSKKYLISN